MRWRVVVASELRHIQIILSLNDHKTLLYPDCADCADGSTKLGTTLELLKWKAETGCTDSGFEKLLKLMKPKFPKGNKLPETIYEAKKTICPLGDRKSVV